MPSKIIEFYEDSGVPYDWEDIIFNWDNDKLDKTKDVIDWMFPVPECSNVPLTQEDITLFKEDVDLMDRIERSLKKFLEFLGLSLVKFGSNWIVAKSAEFSNRRGAVWASHNHNWVRITRVLKCLNALGRDDLSMAFFSCLRQLREREGIGTASYSDWEDAIQ
jgi:hypothetical protein